MTTLYGIAGALLSGGAMLVLAAPPAAGSVLLVPTCFGGNVAIPVGPGAPSHREDGACHALCPHRRTPGGGEDDRPGEA